MSITLGVLLTLNVAILAWNLFMVIHQKRTKVTTSHMLISIDKLETNLILLISLLH